MKTETKNELLKVGVLAALVVAALPEMSWAGATSFAEMAKSVSNDQLTAVPSVVTGLGYVIGTVLMLSGALSLKKHAENPAGEPLNKGLGRLIIGGVVTLLPYLLSVMQTSSSLGTDAAEYNSFGSLTFSP